MLCFRAGDEKRRATLHNAIASNLQCKQPSPKAWIYSAGRQLELSAQNMFSTKRKKKLMLIAALVQYLSKLRAAAAFPEMKTNL